MTDLVCEICGGGLTPGRGRNGRARFCSIKCSAENVRRLNTRPMAERFWEKVDRRGDDECWPWKGATTYYGYGVLGRGRALVRAHRYSYELAHDTSVPTATEVRHKCDNPPCVNPKHLELGTHADNMADVSERKRWRPRTKYSDEMVASIRSASGTVRAIAAAYGVSNCYVSLIRNEKLRPS